MKRSDTPYSHNGHNHTEKICVLEVGSGSHVTDICYTMPCWAIRILRVILSIFNDQFVIRMPAEQSDITDIKITLFLLHFALQASKFTFVHLDGFADENISLYLT